jgi:hypothetical protein
MELTIRCKVYPGQFSGEYAISGAQADGETFSLFVPEQYVTLEQPATRDRSVDGWLRVLLWEPVEDGAIVKLPRESLESGRFVTVRSDQFQTGLQPLETRR